MGPGQHEVERTILPRMADFEASIPIIKVHRTVIVHTIDKAGLSNSISGSISNLSKSSSNSSTEQSPECVIVHFGDEDIKKLASNSAMKTYKISRIQVGERRLKGETGVLVGIRNYSASVAGVSNINHKFLIITLSSCLHVSTKDDFVVSSTLLLERLDTRLCMGLVQEDKSGNHGLRVVDGLNDIRIPQNISLPDLAHAYLTLAECFPDYHLLTSNCWLFCVSMLHLLVSLDVEDWKQSMKVTRRGLWKRKRDGVALTALQRLVFDCVVCFSLGNSETTMIKKILGESFFEKISHIPERWEWSEAGRVVMIVKAFVVSFRILSFYNSRGRKPNASDSDFLRSIFSPI